MEFSKVISSRRAIRKYTQDRMKARKRKELSELVTII